MHGIFPRLTSTALYILFAFSAGALVSADSPQDIASAYGLATSTSLVFPTATLATSDATSFMVSNWGLGKGRVEDDPSDLAFVSDPFPTNPVPTKSDPSNTNGPVLQVDYPAGSFSGATGGAQFTSLFNGSQPWQSMLVSYEVAFAAGFNFVKGGKLPGIRGGPEPDGCSGGSQPTGADCFTARLMWRTNGAGEIYAYIPPTGITCSTSKGQFICNSDFGISIDRGSFTFPTGQWSRVSLLVLLNDPPSESNGYMGLYFNDVQAISQSGLQIRTADTVNATGLFFSTFFGGADSSWATPTDQHTYFRNMNIWASPAGSNLTASSPESSTSQPTSSAKGGKSTHSSSSPGSTATGSTSNGMRVRVFQSFYVASSIAFSLFSVFGML
ncbi:hypothetical protein SISNIDRAFT_422157 [Sistotremastrum niveocremeum HHB9708]|uniref:Polysaccharide lyase 14 domain-containing protein n=1 Tax=Sistotremastrum niveocremeum HHB9708 TaxID=1314777 RepID=A0A165A102_9AGAM|nr:hypothetical protein SISNIDRAFT_422157 [Sistotremastrum niveocremeum HHB9708]